MSNKTSDKNVANEERLNNFIEAYKQTKDQSFIVDSINKDFFFEFVDCLLAEREQMLKAINTVEKEKGEWIEECAQKDKRIQELEEKLLDMIQGTEIINKETPEYVKENYISKQAVIDKIDELGISDEDINIKYVLQELLETK